MKIEMCRRVIARASAKSEEKKINQSPTGECAIDGAVARDGGSRCASRETLVHQNHVQAGWMNETIFRRSFQFGSSLEGSCDRWTVAMYDGRGVHECCEGALLTLCHNSQDIWGIFQVR